MIKQLDPIERTEQKSHNMSTLVFARCWEPLDCSTIDGTLLSDEALESECPRESLSNSANTAVPFAHREAPWRTVQKTRNSRTYDRYSGEVRARLCYRPLFCFLLAMHFLALSILWNVDKICRGDWEWFGCGFEQEKCMISVIIAGQVNA
jgi:hypothetical protein